MLSREAINAAAVEAESAADAGRCREALSCYIELLCELFTEEPAGGQLIDATSGWLVERISELAVVVGQVAPAAKLLEALHLELVHSGNAYTADLIAVKRLQLAVVTGNRAAIAEILRGLQTCVGNFDGIEFTSTIALERMERSCNWPDVRPHERAIFFAEFYHASGRLFTWLGQCADAEGALQRGLTHAAGEARGMEPLRSGMQLDLVSIALLRGDVPTARSRLAALPSTTDPIGSVRRAELAANAAVLSGEFAAAEAALTTARIACESFEFSAGMVATTLNLGYVLLILNRTTEIDALVDEAEPMAERLGDERFKDRLARLRALASARRASTAAAFLSFEPTSQIWGDGEDEDEPVAAAPIELPVDSGASVLERLSDYTLGLYQWFQIGDMPAALHWYEHMQQVFSCSDSPLVQHRLKLLAAMTSYYRRDYLKAAAELDPLLEQLRRLGLRHDLWLACSVRLWCYTKLKEQNEVRRSLAVEAQALIDVMGQGLSSAARAVFELNKWSEDEVDLAARFEDLIQQSERAHQRRWPARWIERLRIWTLLDELIAHLDARRALALYRENPSDARRPWWSRVLRWQWGRVTLSFLVLPDRLFAVREGFLHLDLARIPVNRVDLRKIVKGWHESMLKWSVAVRENNRSMEEKCAADLAEVSREVSDKLRLPELLDLNSIRHLRIVPDDSLHGLPFAALLHNGRRLAEKFALSFDVRHIPTLHRRPKQPALRKALVAAMSLEVGSRDPLAHAKGEAERVELGMRRRGFDVTSLSDEEVTPQAIADGLEKAAAAHIICHGQFSPDSMKDTGLCLYDAGNQALLSLMDLAKRDFSRLEFVALSSCWSADNYILPGRTVISLPQVIRGSGAQSVLSCLWQIDDEVGAVFFKRFYELACKHPELKALQQTQAEFTQGLFPMKGGLLSTTEPFYWAGYTLHCSG